MAELYSGTYSGDFIPSDICDRLKILYNMDVFLLSSEGELIVQSKIFEGVELSLLQEAKRYVKSVLDTNSKDIHPMMLQDVWRWAFENNLHLLLFLEQTFFVTVFFEEGTFYCSPEKQWCANIFRDLIATNPSTSENSMCNTDAYLRGIPYGNLLLASNKLTEGLKQAIILAIQKKSFHSKSSGEGPSRFNGSQSSRIFNDIDLNVIEVADEQIPEHLITVFNFNRLKQRIREIPSDIFQRVSYHFNTSLYIHSPSPDELVLQVPAEADLLRNRIGVYINSLILSMMNYNYFKSLPRSWQDIFSEMPQLMYSIEKHFSVIIIFDYQTKSVALLAAPEISEIFHSHLFTDAYSEEDSHIDIDVATDVICSKEIMKRVEVQSLPRIIMQRFASFLEEYDESLQNNEIQSNPRKLSKKGKQDSAIQRENEETGATAAGDVIDLTTDDIFQEAVPVPHEAASRQITTDPHVHNSKAKSENLIDLTTDDIPEVVARSPRLSPAGLQKLKKIDALTYKMKTKLTQKTERAMCLGFDLVSVIKVISEKGPDGAALLSEDNFIGILCDAQVANIPTEGTSELTPSSTAHYTPLQLRFKKSFENKYPTLRPTVASDDANKSLANERHELLIAALKEYVEIEDQKQAENADDVIAVSSSPMQAATRSSSTKVIPQNNHFRRRRGDSNSKAGVSSGESDVDERRGKRDSKRQSDGNSTPTGVATKLVKHSAPSSIPNKVTSENQMDARRSLFMGRGHLFPENRQNDSAGNSRNKHWLGYPYQSSNVSNTQNCGPSTSATPQEFYDNLQESNEAAFGLLNMQPHFPQYTLPRRDDQCRLRPVIIDGCNVSFGHGNNQVFSAYGMVAAVTRYLEIGCTNIHVMLPRSRQGGPGAEIIADLERKGYLTLTPSRCLEDKRLGRKTYQTPYDDRLILRAAVDLDGVVVSNDNFRDIKNENPEFEFIVNHRTLMYCFVGDKFLVAEDPFGQNGPTLMDILSKDGRPSMSDVLSRPEAIRSRMNLDLPSTSRPHNHHNRRQRTVAETEKLREQLTTLLPEQVFKINKLLNSDLWTKNPDRLATKLLSS